jgi:glycosyltransferase involved in cell wall biosynthesis
MKKKVLYLITKATWGGAQRYVFDLATHLPESEYKVVIAYGQYGKLAKDLSEAGIRTREITSLRRDVAVFSDIASFFGIWKCILTEKPDVVHLNSSKAAGLGALAARLCGVKKIIFTVHGWPFKENRLPMSRMVIYFISWFTAFLSNAVIVVSKEDEAIGERMRWVGKKIFYIPIGIETPHFHSRSEASMLLSITTLSPRIVTIAELHPNKGLRYALAAMAELTKRGMDASYFILGDGEERQTLETLAREYHVSERVRFLGFIPDAARFLKAFDIFVLPSIKEGMPYVLLEAAEAGMQIVTTTAVNPDVIERYEQVRAVSPADATRLADAILEAATAREERSLFPTRTIFPLSTMVEATRALY